MSFFIGTILYLNITYKYFYFGFVLNDFDDDDKFIDNIHKFILLRYINKND